MANLVPIECTLEVYERLCRVAENYGGLSLSETIDRLIAEHEDAQARTGGEAPPDRSG